MQKVKGMVICRRKIVKGGIAHILNSADNLELVGREGADTLEEAFELQPDLIIYELHSMDNNEYAVIRELKNLCAWTKIILYSASPLNRHRLKQFLEVCDGYLQGPLLPGFLLKAVELACYSGYFFFLGSSKDIKQEVKNEVQEALPDSFSRNN